ncbi:MaoC family dehydratase [Mycolicibacterium sp. P9-22]|uniref:MaoC family dehydratase n=1 Tax=Mycolicibacterium sp. P9-22 TaxID=2024613 RepID=UPI0011EF3BC8|nr:MaoC family dehydratase [Mycolicibacterium sp. P9-22]KAA0120912.1 acyl dehydratase [Mycolicibacterium sp. P9-22]
MHTERGSSVNAGNDVSATVGPYFDELRPGQVFDHAPAMTLTEGAAAVHQSIVGDRMRLALDATLSAAVTGGSRPMAHPALVADIAIGQSTLATGRVRANLFYRGLAFHRFPELGDALATTTQVVGLRQNSVRQGRAPTGLAALRMKTVDQHGRLVLDFHRCAMLPLSSGVLETGHFDDLTALGTAEITTDPARSWDAETFRSRVPGPHFGPELHDRRYRSSGDVVSSAPELARLSLNIAATHHDRRAGGQRLVYGGHTIGLALAQATRLLPNLATVLKWTSCDHTGPVHEGDTLYSDLHVEQATALPDGRGGTLDLRSVVYAVGLDGEADRPVLDWRFTALLF